MPAFVCLINLTNCRGRSAALGLKSTLGIVWACPLKQERHPRLSSPYPRPTTTEIPSKWPVVPRDVTATARTRYEQFCLPPPPTDEHQDPPGAQKMLENGASGEEEDERENIPLTVMDDSRTLSRASTVVCPTPRFASSISVARRPTSTSSPSAFTSSPTSMSRSPPRPSRLPVFAPTSTYQRHAPEEKENARLTHLQGTW
jgi:hypothetical protein